MRLLAALFYAAFAASVHCIEERYDLNHDGRVELGEVEAVAFSDHALPKALIKEIFASADVDQDNYLLGGELDKVHQVIQEYGISDAVQWLKMHDLSGDGFIGAAEFILPSFMAFSLPKTEYQHIFDTSDGDSDQKMNPKELSHARSLLRNRMLQLADEALKHYDSDGNHRLSPDEALIMADVTYDVGTREAENATKASDTDHDGAINGAEMLTFLELLRREAIKAADDKLKIIDENANGMVTYGEVKKFFGGKVEGRTFKGMFKDFDMNRNLAIEAPEYVSLQVAVAKQNKEKIPVPTTTVPHVIKIHPKMANDIVGKPRARRYAEASGSAEQVATRSTQDTLFSEDADDEQFSLSDKSDQDPYAEFSYIRAVNDGLGPNTIPEKEDKMDIIKDDLIVKTRKWPRKPSRKTVPESEEDVTRTNLDDEQMRTISVEDDTEENAKTQTDDDVIATMPKDISPNSEEITDKKGGLKEVMSKNKEVFDDYRELPMEEDENSERQSVTSTEISEETTTAATTTTETTSPSTTSVRPTTRRKYYTENAGVFTVVFDKNMFTKATTPAVFTEAPTPTTTENVREDSADKGVYVYFGNQAAIQKASKKKWTESDEFSAKALREDNEDLEIDHIFEDFGRMKRSLEVETAPPPVEAPAKERSLMELTEITERLLRENGGHGGGIRKPLVDTLVDEPW